MQHTRTGSKCLLEEECMTLHDYMTLASNCMTCAPLVTRVSTSHFHVDCRLCYLWILDTVALCRCMESDSHCAVHSPCMRWEMGQWGSNTGRSVIYFVVSTFIYHLYLLPAWLTKQEFAPLSECCLFPSWDCRRVDLLTVCITFIITPRYHHYTWENNRT